MAPAPKRYSCPVEVTVDVIGGKWAPVILAHLKQQTLRFSELRRLMPRTSEKMLAQRLHELEAAGLILRTTDGAVPPRVDYSLTDEGRSLAPVLQALYDWGASWAEAKSLIIERAAP
jgi:DNA-binding HxlR family transcriptional regulator